MSLAYLGRDEEALACYDKALEIDPKDAHALSNKGVSLAELVGLARGGILWTLAPGQEPGAHVLPAAGAAVLSAEERDLVSEVLGLHFEQPPRGRRRTGLRSLVLAVRSALSRAMSTIVSRLRHWRTLDET